MKNKDEEYQDRENYGKYHEEYISHKREKKISNLLRQRNIDPEDLSDLYDWDEWNGFDR